MRLEFCYPRSENTLMLFRRMGYSPDRRSNPAEPSFHRRLGAYPFPRFHVYVRTDEANHLVFMLHLDAKQPSYNGTAAHAGEYTGPVVEVEAQRLTEMIESYRSAS